MGGISAIESTYPDCIALTLETCHCAPHQQRLIFIRDINACARGLCAMLDTMTGRGGQAQHKREAMVLSRYLHLAKSGKTDADAKSYLYVLMVLRPMLLDGTGNDRSPMRFR